MRAVISGEAGLALVLHPHASLQTLGGSVADTAHVNAGYRLLAGSNDLVHVEVSSQEELHELAEREWARDRSERLAIFLLDPDEAEDFKRECADCLEELFGEFEIRQMVLSRLLSATVPNCGMLSEAINAAANFPAVRSLFESLQQMQPAVAIVRSAFDSIELWHFKGDGPAILNTLIFDGAFAEIAQAVYRGEDLKFLKLKLLSRHLHLRSIIERWFSSLTEHTSSERVREVFEKSHDYDLSDEDEIGPFDRHSAKAERYPNHNTFLKIEERKAEILPYLRGRQLSEARNLANALIDAQRKSSTARQIGMTLCSLSREAERLDVPELQLEWAQRATEECPEDIKTYGHLVDALIDLSRFDEAYHYIDIIISGGGKCYGYSSQARILRLTGLLYEARACYLSTAYSYDFADGVMFAYLGAAEVLRDLGDNEGALIEYDYVTKRWPSEAGAWSGRASILMDMGRLDEAIVAFRQSDWDSTAVAKTGMATAYRLAGRFAEAHRCLDDLLVNFPNNPFVLCGKAEVLRLQGRRSDSLKFYDLAMKRAPNVAAVYSGKGGVLKEMGDLILAEAMYDKGIEKFPRDVYSRIGKASILELRDDIDGAFQQIDAILDVSPYDISAKCYRAFLLGKRGLTAEALSLFDAALSQQAHSQIAQTGKAQLLISLGRYDEARALLPDAEPASLMEWRRYALRCFLVEGLFGHRKAVKMLVDGISRCPFSRERDILRNALALVQMGRGRYHDALRTIASVQDDLSNVVALHAFAAVKSMGPARDKFDQILKSNGPARIVELAVEIARRHNLVSEAPKEVAGWVERRERELLILEAA